jgi:hypothetical protein
VKQLWMCEILIHEREITPSAVPAGWARLQLGGKQAVKRPHVLVRLRTHLDVAMAQITHRLMY